MRIFVCIDDTDNIDSRGTGELASIMAQQIIDKGWGEAKGVTRHQLFIHPDIPYTSHNSSMCFEADIQAEFLQEFVAYACGFLKTESAEGSDPGLCIAAADKVAGNSLLMEFSRKAKSEIVTKEEAYTLADESGIHLSEHGGTGQGVIGALAGIGLRMSGNDGRFKGKIKFETENGIASVSNILSNTFIERVKDINGSYLGENELIVLGDALKAVLLDGKATLLVISAADKEAGTPVWQLCSKQRLKAF